MSTRQSPELDALAQRWWAAFATARSALDVVRALVGGEELTGRQRRLAEERGEVAVLLQAITREQHADSWFVRWFSGPVTSGTLGLPGDVSACVFDLDGVLTASATVHASAWSESLNSFLSERAKRTRREFVPFDRSDYQLSFAGRPRLEGVRALLASRGISLSEGTPDDPPGAETVHGLANRKNAAFRRRLDRDGVSAFEGSRTYLEAARMIGLLVAVVSASSNTTAILERAGISQLIEQRVDGKAIEAEHLRPKPAPDTLLAACRRLDIEPQHTVAFETTAAGVAAARAADFRLVIGVDRSGHSRALRTSDADLVVGDLADLLDRAERA